LKSSTQDGDGDLSMEPGVMDEPSQQAENAVSALDVTETFSGTTYVGKVLMCSTREEKILRRDD